MHPTTSASSRSRRAAGLALAALLALAAPALAQTPPPSRPATPPASGRAAAVAPADRDYLRQAAEAIAAQLDLDKLGRDRGRGAGVRDVARRSMVADQAASEQLVALAKARRVSLEFSSDLGAEELKRLGDLQGIAFDSAFLDAHVAGQRRMMALHDKAAKATGDAEIRRFAVEAMQSLRPRLANADAMAKAERSPIVSTPTPYDQQRGPVDPRQPVAPAGGGMTTYAPPPSTPVPPVGLALPSSPPLSASQPGFENYYRGTRDAFVPRDYEGPIR
jgi:predicted outer membrane protein